MFVVSTDQREKIASWLKEHACGVRPDSFGGLVTYQFTPSGIGDSVKALCPCGATLDLTDYEGW